MVMLEYELVTRSEVTIKRSLQVLAFEFEPAARHIEQFIDGVTVDEPIISNCG